MKKPKISMRVFIVLWLLVGAIAVPWGWTAYHSRKERLATEKATTVESLKKELAKLWRNEPDNSRTMPRVVMTSSGFEVIPSSYTKWKDRVVAIQDRLEQLTGSRPVRPESKYERVVRLMLKYRRLLPQEDYFDNAQEIARPLESDLPTNPSDVAEE